MKKLALTFLLLLSVYYLFYVCVSSTVPKAIVIIGWIGTVCGNAIMLFESTIEDK